MNSKIATNPCVRCGQERIVGKTWVEKIENTGGISKLTHTLMVCPDPACQAKLEKELNKQKEARISRAKLKEEQDLARKERATPKTA